MALSGRSGGVLVMATPTDEQIAGSFTLVARMTVVSLALAIANTVAWVTIVAATWYRQ